MAKPLAPEKARLTDCHVHLDHLVPEERERALERSRAAGVRFLVTAGMDIASSSAAVALALPTKGILAGVGVHPWNADRAPRDFAQTLRQEANSPGVVAIAEAGLDFENNVFTGVSYRDNPALRQAQERVLREEIALACELRLPLVLHARGAYAPLVRILREEKADRVGGAIHNFDTDVSTARVLFDLQFLASFGGTATFPTQTAVHALVRFVPLDRILLETDSPYMPLYQDSQKNEPANVARVAQSLADLRGIALEELVQATFENFTALFGVSR
jgi:TatD DNase family protein